MIEEPDWGGVGAPPEYFGHVSRGEGFLVCEPGLGGDDAALVVDAH